MSVRTPLLVLGSLLVLAPGAAAQSATNPDALPRVGLDLIAADPRGEFADYVGSAFGLDAWGRLALDPAGILSLRADLGFLIYGHETKRVCVGGTCRIQARLQTSNNIFFGGIGPELAIPLGWARPYANASLGFGYFSTTSSLEDLGGGDDTFSTENFGDGTFSWGLGWGVEIRVSRGRTPVALDLGARYHRNGVMEYLTEGDIVDNSDGSITLYPNRSEANYIAYRFGISIGIPRGGEDDELGNGRNR